MVAAKLFSVALAALLAVGSPQAEKCEPEVNPNAPRSVEASVNRHPKVGKPMSKEMRAKLGLVW